MQNRKKKKECKVRDQWNKRMEGGFEKSCHVQGIK